MSLLIIVGTRPEAIKLAPLVLTARSAGIETFLLSTGQHREMVPKILSAFELQTDLDLDIMKPGQSLAEITRSVMEVLPSHLDSIKPKWVIVQGDTSTAFAAALAAFYAKIPVAHVEAGLRTWNFDSPFPEEMNRHLLSKLATFHFAPTEGAKQNLLLENIPAERIEVTGNTGIDTLKWLTRKFAEDLSLRNQIYENLLLAGIPDRLVSGKQPFILVTSHRRENLGEGLRNICQALCRIVETRPNFEIVFPIHPNPAVREIVTSAISQEKQQKIHLVQPMDYLPFVRMMSLADLILTDSGGVQEEAPSLAKRVIVLRDTTERPEGLSSPFVRMGGLDEDRILQLAQAGLDGEWQVPSGGSDLYGDGRASHRILATLRAKIDLS